MKYKYGHTDGARQPRLIDKCDIDVLISHHLVSKYVDGCEDKIKDLQDKITEEQSRKYPNKKYIARCQEKIDQINISITLYNKQRQQ